MKVGEIIYFKLYRIDMLEIVKGTAIGLHGGYIWAVTDSDEDLPRTLVPSDIQTKEGYELWQSFYKIQNDISELKAKEEEMYKKLKAIPKASKGGYLKS